MRKRNYIILLSILAFLLTGCTKNYYEGKGDKHFAQADYEEAEEYYLKSLERTSESRVYIKLANLYRETYRYEDEKEILLDGIEAIGACRDLNFRYAKYQNFIAGEDQYLSAILEQRYDREVLKELFEISSDASIEIGKGPIEYYKEYRSEIEDVDLKILAYKTVDEDNVLKDELEEELIEIEEVETYEALIARAYDDGEYKRVEELIVDLDDMKKVSGISKLYTKLLAMEDVSIIDKRIGYFKDQKRRDMAVVYTEDIEYKGEDNSLHLSLIDGETGEIIIDEAISEDYPYDISLDVSTSKDKLDRLGISKNREDSTKAGKGFRMYEFTEDGIETVDHVFEDDIEVELLEDFKIKIESERLALRYIIDIPKSDRAKYVEDEQYSEAGIPNPGSGASHFVDNFFLKKRGDYKDTVNVLQGFGGSDDYSGSRLGYIEELYNEIDGEFISTYLYIKTIDGMDRKSEFEDDVRIITMTETSIDTNFGR